MTADDGSFSARAVPWMKIGHVIEDDVTAAEAARLGGLDFDVELKPAGYLNQPGTSKWRRAEGRFAIVRPDTGDVFNYTTETYEPVQYRDAFTFMDQINPRYVAAGSFNGGRQGFIVSQLPERTSLDLKLGGETDHYDLYAVLRTSQNLSRGIEVSLLTLRDRCMNELTLPSLTRNAVQSWSYRHTKSVHEKMSQAADVLTKTDRYVDAFTDQTTRLVKVTLDTPDAEKILRAALPDRPKREEQVTAILDRWRTSPTVGFETTGYGLTMAASEYFEHGRPMNRGRSEQSRFTGALDGATHKYVARVAQLALRTR